MEIMLYDKMPIIGNILKDWLLELTGEDSKVKGYSELTGIALDKHYDLAVFDADYPTDELYSVINSLFTKNPAMRLLFTTFSTKSEVDYSKLPYPDIKSFDKASGYLSFCQSVQALIT